MLPQKAFAWVDLETTGSSKEHDLILEMALVLTDATPKLNVLDERQWLVTPTREGWYESMSAFVTRMHSDNGLLADMKNAETFPLPLIDSQLVYALQARGFKSKADVMLAGSGVSHFDRAFLRRDLPRFEAVLAYPNMDVGCIRRALSLMEHPALMQDAGADQRNHRAMDDVMHHIEELRHYCAELKLYPSDTQKVLMEAANSV